jgi:ATP-dependent protease HslVU (ClpYQ) ATPase subunit
MTVCERIFRDFKFELPSTKVRRFVVTEELVNHPKQELQKLLTEHVKEEQAVTRQLVNDFAARFAESHKITIRFTDGAADRLAALALEQTVPVRDFCAARFKDFQFGLKLISQNTGRQEFLIDIDAVNEPDKVLSDWVVKSYGGHAGCKT